AAGRDGRERIPARRRADGGVDRELDPQRRAEHREGRPGQAGRAALEGGGSMSGNLFTPRMSVTSNERYKLQISGDDHAKIMRGQNWEAIVTDIETGV